MTSSRTICHTVAIAAIGCALGAADARANGRYPATIDVHFSPGDPDIIALQVTWGLLFSGDGGETWQWSCEEAVGFGGVYDPDYAFTPTGLLLATTTSADGLRLTRDRCTWTPAPPPLGDPDGTGARIATFVSQVEVDPIGRIFAAASTATDAQIYRSDDDAVTFAPIANPGPEVDWWETLVAAPTLLGGVDARLYLAGYDLPSAGDKQRVLFRSDDSGVTWSPLPTTDFSFGGDLADLQIAAVSPTDPDVVFARVFQANGQSLGDDLYRSVDAGQTWTRVLQATDDITAVVIRLDGEVIATTRQSGIHRSADGGMTFGAAITGRQIYCMKERADGILFACGLSFQPENFALGSGASVDALTPIMTFADVDEPVPCPAGTVQHDVCEALRWPFMACQFGIPDPEVECGIPPDAGTPDAGAGGDGSRGCCDAGGSGSSALLTLFIALFLRRRKMEVHHAR